MQPADASVAIFLVIAVALHIAEETAKNFRGFLNTVWFAGDETCPVGRFKGLFIDKIGLFGLLAGTAVAGALFDPRWILLAVGVISADLVQHSIFSVRERAYTPGVATCAIYLIYLAVFFGQGELRDLLELPLAWEALALGAAFIGGNYALAAWKVWRGDCRPASRS